MCILSALPLAIPPSSHRCFWEIFMDDHVAVVMGLRLPSRPLKFWAAKRTTFFFSCVAFP